MDILFQMLLEVSKTVVREIIVFGFKKITSKKQKKTTRKPAKRGRSSKKRKN
ncbi:hypothetical protein [Bacillus thuringiensis]|uniref:hypothetical protein n=1 Tax=Bacillus thuringiensis TaxID=1428 RepID=UPI002AB58784|nr:hypothetical protein [Bacillus thuringiensis]MDY8166068.1 hypothetical protein [Bacillus thuringiensis]